MQEKILSMSEFALSFLREHPGANPNWLASEWHEYKTGRYPPAASRDRFGLTSAAYRTLRKLQSEGRVRVEGDYKHYIT